MNKKQIEYFPKKKCNCAAQKVTRKKTVTQITKRDQFFK